MRKSIIRSQNFLRDQSLIQTLVESTSLHITDTVIDIGAGQGAITRILAQTCRQVIAYEIDPNLFQKLKNEFNQPNVSIHNVDFLQATLPDYPYKVFANIPFNLTAAIIHKLTESHNPPSDVYLVVQKDAALKFTGRPLAFNNSQLSLLLKPWFDLNLVYFFRPHDFMPIAKVAIVLLRLLKRPSPLITTPKDLYFDFIVFGFSQHQPTVKKALTPVFGPDLLEHLCRVNHFSLSVKPTELDINHWLCLFQAFINEVPASMQTKVKGAYPRQLKQQQALTKIHRTRLDPNWKQSMI